MKIYKITEASEYLGVSINTLKTLANNGKISSFKTSGKHRRFRQDDLDAYMGVKKEKQEKLTVKKQVAWTQSEIDILIKKGSELFLHELADLIPRHSPIAIGAKDFVKTLKDDPKAIVKWAKKEIKAWKAVTKETDDEELISLCINQTDSYEELIKLTEKEVKK